jgi:peroxiredoxin
VGFTLLSDPGSTVIDRYALRDPAYAGADGDGLPRPAVFVLDEKGIVRWRQIETDYTQRPSVAEIQTALDAVRGRHRSPNG